MKEILVYETPALYRDSFRIRGFQFGSGEKAMCIVGAMRGNEYQQIYIASQLVSCLTALEADKRIVPGKEILVIPSANPTSMNLSSRFWPIDHTDINRMFPGYHLGETTQRIAAGLFETASRYASGVQLTSFYASGDFSPHVRMMRTGFENVEKAKLFGLPYVMVRSTRPYDTTTLNYNWQIWETNAYSVYSRTTDHIDLDSANQVIEAILRYLAADGVISGRPSSTVESRVVDYGELINLRSEASGLYLPFVSATQRVNQGQLLGQIFNAATGEILHTFQSPCDGEVFFQHGSPLIYPFTCALKVLPKADSLESEKNKVQ